jgi:hypothetical protein
MGGCSLLIFYFEAQQMFQRLTDEHGYQRGWIIKIPSVFTLLKYQVNKIMDKYDYILVMAIFGCEFVIR